MCLCTLKYKLQKTLFFSWQFLKCKHLKSTLLSIPLEPYLYSVRWKESAKFNKNTINCGNHNSPTDMVGTALVFFQLNQNGREEIQYGSRVLFTRELVFVTFYSSLLNQRSIVIIILGIKNKVFANKKIIIKF